MQAERGLVVEVGEDHYHQLNGQASDNVRPDVNGIEGVTQTPALPDVYFRGQTGQGILPLERSKAAKRIEEFVDPHGAEAVQAGDAILMSGN